VILLGAGIDAELERPTGQDLPPDKDQRLEKETTMACRQFQWDSGFTWRAAGGPAIGFFSPSSSPTIAWLLSGPVFRILGRLANWSPITVTSVIHLLDGLRDPEFPETATGAAIQAKLDELISGPRPSRQELIGKSKTCRKRRSRKSKSRHRREGRHR